MRALRTARAPTCAANRKNGPSHVRFNFQGACACKAANTVLTAGACLQESLVELAKCTERKHRAPGAHVTALTKADLSRSSALSCC